MKTIPVIAIFDVGRTNKKLFLFDQQYKIVFEESRQIEETKDEDGFACEDVEALTKWIKDSFARSLVKNDFDIKAVNFSAYGASFVYLGIEGKVIAPLYNYLKPYPSRLQKKFYDDYGGESVVAKQTASPVLGSLNSGMQLYRLKYEKPEIFSRIKHALHLPQYLSYVLSSSFNTDITSIGSHTNLWHFQKNDYHRWVKNEGILEKFPPIKSCTEIAGYVNNIPVGAGLHDSSAALIPYLSSVKESFVLLSTGTWCISLNPFNHSMLSDYELHHDCLCYLSFEGKPVKASRLFAGYEHEQQVKKLAAHFHKELDYYKKVQPDYDYIKQVNFDNISSIYQSKGPMTGESKFSKRNLNDFDNYEQAYHQLIIDVVEQQIRSTNLVLKGTEVKRIFVDGGFSRNAVYMNLLTIAFPSLEIYAAHMAEATSLGAALAIHHKWNNNSLPADIIKLKLYSHSFNQQQ
jgi:sugar (pentulose or hexulose) kinase